jgi:hypothetical protein
MEINDKRAAVITNASRAVKKGFREKDQQKRKAAVYSRKGMAINLAANQKPGGQATFFKFLHQETGQIKEERKCFASSESSTRFSCACGLRIPIIAQVKSSLNAC